jgi:predicted  nucleic acid-binding Zn-ribbon protein
MDLLVFLKEYWTILVFIGAVIMSWARYEAKNNSQDRDITDLQTRMKYTENKLEAHIASNNTIQESLNRDIAIIKTTLEYIKEGLEELKNKRK